MKTKEELRTEKKRLQYSFLLSSISGIVLFIVIYFLEGKDFKLYETIYSVLFSVIVLGLGYYYITKDK